MPACGFAGVQRLAVAHSAFWNLDSDLHALTLTTVTGGTRIYNFLPSCHDRGSEFLEAAGRRSCLEPRCICLRVKGRNARLRTHKAPACRWRIQSALVGGICGCSATGGRFRTNATRCRTAKFGKNVTNNPGREKENSDYTTAPGRAYFLFRRLCIPATQLRKLCSLCVGKRTQGTQPPYPLFILSNAEKAFHTKTARTGSLLFGAICVLCFLPFG